MSTHPISVAIFTRNRPKQTLRLLRCIKRQTVLPNNLLIVENTTEHQWFDKDQLQQLFHLKKIVITYHPLKAKNVAVSRNIALKYFTSGILFFFDDDVVVRKNFIRDSIHIFVSHPKYFGLVFPIRATQKNTFSLFGQANSNLSFSPRNQFHEIQFCGLPIGVFRAAKIRKHHLKFDENLDAGEDIDFSLRAHKKGEKIYYCPSIACWHEFPQKNIFDICKTHYRYAKNFFVLEERHPKNFQYSELLPKKKIDWISFPIFFLTLRFFHSVWEKEDQKKFPFLIYVVERSILFGLYTSKIGREKLKDSFKNSFSL